MRRVTTRPLDEPVPLLDHPPTAAWLTGDLQLVGWGEALRIDAGRGPRRIATAGAAWQEAVARVEIDDRVGVPGSGLVAFGSFTFDGGSSGSTLLVPRVLVGRRGRDWWVTTVDDTDPGPLLHPAGTGLPVLDRPRYAGSSMPDVLWMEAVAEVVSRIRQGQVEKVVLARDLAVWSKVPFDVRVLAQRLHERFLDCFTFLVDGLIGASPELLVRRRGRAVESLALAGSAPRRPDPEDDLLAGKALLGSDKDRREHRAAVESVERVLLPLCDGLERSDPELLRLPNVQHLATRFRGELTRPVGSLQLVDQLHPTAAVGGTPTAAAVELIRQLEGMDRGRYAGPVGWVDAAGDGEWAIALRCAELSGARARLFAGAGIVEGSLPEMELEETRLKLLAMMSVLDPE